MRPTASLRLSVVLVLVLGAAVSPVSAGALAVTHELNWGVDDATTAAMDPGTFHFPADVAVDKWGNVYVAGGENGDSRVQQFTSEGVYVRHIGAAGGGTPAMDDPRSVATDRWGMVYVAEKGNTPKLGKYFKEFYSADPAQVWTGSGGDIVYNPASVGVALDGTVYSTENGEKLMRWTPQGNFFFSWVTDGPPVGVAPGPDGQIYVANAVAPAPPYPNHVMAYTPFGVYLDRWGGTGSADGQFDWLNDVSVDGAGNVYTMESGGSRGQVFDAEGTYLDTFGSSGTGDTQFQGPYGIGAGLDRTVYVADTFNSRISKWTVDVPAAYLPVAGMSRYGTAAAASQKAFPFGSQSEYAVVATGKNWPDALGGAALAGTLHAPLLLTDPATLSPDVTGELTRLNVQEIYVVGGESAVSASVYNALAAQVGPGDIRRVWGGSRYETANEIADEVVSLQGGNYDGTAFVVTGRNFPDALAASPIAAANHWPIILTEPAAIPASVKTTMVNNGMTHGYIIGGTSAVSAAIETDLDNTFIDYVRYGAGNRYATAAEVATRGFEGMGMLWSRPAIATGEDFPDALAGGVLQGSDYSLLLLTPNDSLDPATAQALEDNSQRIYEMRFLGGLAAVDADTRDEAMALLPQGPGME